MKIVISAVLVLLLSACAQNLVRTDYDSARDFSAYQTFSWISDDKMKRHLLVDTDLVDRRVRASVEANLAALGLSPAKAGDSSDVIIAYHYDVKDQFYVDSYHSFGGYAPWWHYHHFGGPRGSVNDVDVRHYDQGVLIIDLIDARDNKLFWRGITERRIRKNLTPEQRDTDINQLVTRILAEYPTAQ